MNFNDCLNYVWWYKVDGCLIDNKGIVGGCCDGRKMDILIIIGYVLYK